LHFQADTEPLGQCFAIPGNQFSIAARYRSQTIYKVISCI